MSLDLIRRIDVLPLTIPRDVPYLGPPEGGVMVTERGYFRRSRNATVYGSHLHSVVIKLTTQGEQVGWGECNAVVAPEATAALIADLLAPFYLGRSPHEVVSLYHENYDAMRVRGFFGGHYHDAIAGLDIALWDLRGRLLGLSVSRLLGDAPRERLPCYVSGLPRATLAERQELAREWLAKGFDAFKIPLVVGEEDEEAEIAGIREAVGPAAKIAVDLHWRYTSAEAVALLRRLERHDPWFAEAPLKPEEVEGLADLARASAVPIAIGEELRNRFEYLPRFQARAMSIIQPEMGRTGISEMRVLCDMARTHHCQVAPHASIGVGIYQAASMQAVAGIPHLLVHEYQPSIFDDNARYLRTPMVCERGCFHLPRGPGLGIEPNEEFLREHCPAPLSVG